MYQIELVSGEDSVWFGLSGYQGQAPGRCLSWPSLSKLNPSLRKLLIFYMAEFIQGGNS